MTTTIDSREHDADSPAAQVERLYDIFLNREADVGGLSSYLDRIKAGLPIDAVAADMLGSQEFQQQHQGQLSNSQFVELMYNNALGRDPLTSGSDLGGFQSWVDRLDAGMSRISVALQISESPEHQLDQAALYAQGLPVPDDKLAFVEHLYESLLGRAGEDEGLASWVNLLNSGVSQETVAARFLGSDEFRSQHGDLTNDVDFIQALYRGALGRSAEQGGLQSYLDQLAHGVTRAQVAVSITQSQEAGQHLAPVLGNDYAVLDARNSGPTISASPSSGPEDGAVPLGLTVTSPAAGTVGVTVAGVPSGATLNHGTDLGGGTWTLAAADLSGLALVPAADASGSFDLTVTATLHPASGTGDVVATSALHVTVNPVSDTPTLSITTTSATVDEDHPVPLQIAAAQTDTDGSETIAVTISGVPTGATLNHGSTSGGGLWTVAATDLPGLVFAPAANASGNVTLHVTAVSQDGSAAPASSATQDIAITINPVSDIPSLTAPGAVTGNEDTALVLGIAASTPDTDGSETLTITVAGVPTGAALSAGTSDGAGTWTLTGSQLAGLTLTPAPNVSSNFTLHVTATTQDGGAVPVSSATQDIAVTVNPVSDTPILTVGASASGNEDGSVPLSISSALVDTDGSETLSITIANVPTGATLSAGTSDGAGTWTLASTDLPGLTLTPAPNASGSVTLHVTATAQDGSAASASTSHDIVVTVSPVSDTPTLSVGATASGNEDTAIPLSIASALTDTDGSETLAITISGVPSGATLSAGTSDGAGTWTLTEAQLAGLTLTPAANASGSFTLHVAASSQDGTAAPATTLTQDIAVTVSPVTDAPVFAVTATASGSEDTAIPLGISASLADTDGSETLSVTVTGVPTGAGLSAGIDHGGGTWTLTPSQLAGLSLTPAANASGSFNLHVTATAQDGSAAPVSSSGDIAVTVVGVADAPSLTVQAASGGAATTIPLSIQVALTDTDGSETLGDVQIIGVPTAYTLNAGQLTDGGIWVVPVDQLSTLSMTSSSPTVFGSFSLQVVAKSVEAGVGLPATTSANLNVVVTAPANVQAGQVVDGYISGATVFADHNGNGILDAGEVSATTQADGSFKLVGAAAGDPLVMIGGTDISTGSAFTGTLKAVGGSSVITPLTTLVQAIVANSGGSTTAAAAETSVKSALGLSSAVDLSSFDPVSATAGGDPNGAAVLSAGIQVQATVTQLAAAGSVASASVVSSLASTISSSGGAVDLGNASTITSIGTGSGLSADAANGVGSVTAAANTSIATAASTVTSDTTALLTAVVKAATVAINDTTAAIASTNFSDSSATSTLQTNFTGTNLNTAVNAATVAVVSPPVVGTIGNDTVDHHADTAPLVISGLDGDDVLIGGSGDDQIFGGAGRDTLTGGPGNNLLDGGAGLDRADYAGAGGAISVNLSAGTVTGGYGGSDTLTSVETVRGTSAADTYTAAGYTAASHLSAGQAVNDQGSFNEFEGLGGNDTITGNGNTRVSYQTAAAAVTVTLGTGGSGSATGTVAGDAAGIGTDTFVSGVNQIRGSAFDDHLVGSNTAGGDPRISEVFEGLGGNDIIDGNGGFDRVRYDNFSPGANGISVNMAAGTVTGRDAAATAVVGTDTLHSIESVVGSNSNDLYDATGYTNRSTLASGVNDQGNFNEFEGVGGDDTIIGNGATRISYIRANAGVTVTITDAAGDGTAHGTAPNDLAGVGTDTFTGVNAVRGTNYADMLIGSNFNGNNTENFDGRGGDDTIDGGAGFDRARYDTDFYTGLGISAILATGVVTGRDAAAVAVAGTDHLVQIESITGTYANDIFDARGYTANTDLRAGNTTNDQGTFNEFEGVGGDDLIYGNGNTRVSYTRALAGVTVTVTDNGAGSAHGTDAGDLAFVGTDTFMTGVNGVRGSNFDDLITSTNSITSSFNENFDGYGGNDLIDGGLGNDLVRYDTLAVGSVGIQVNMAAGTVTSSDAVTLAAYGSDTLRHIELIRGTDAADTYDATGFSGSSTNAGSSGTFNQFEGRGGDDTIIGNGFTSISYGTANTAVTVDFTTHTAHGTAAGDVAGIGNDTFSGVNSVIGSNFNDHVIASTEVTNVSLGAGIDELTLAATGSPTYSLSLSGVETVDTIGSANELVQLNTVSGPVAIDLGDGTDTVALALTGTTSWSLNLAHVENLISSNLGSQTVNLTSAQNGLHVDLGPGTDTLVLYGPDNSVSNTVSVTNVETIIGLNANNHITFDPNGQLAQNFSFGAGTTNVIDLDGTGNTFSFGVTGSGANLTINGRPGDDHLTISSSIVNATIDLGGGTNSLDLTNTVGFSNITVKNVQSIHGSSQGETITLGTSALPTTIVGGGGPDSITASSGEDHFRFTAISDSGPSLSDLITNFQGGTAAGHDFFEFSGISFAGGQLDYIGTSAFSATGHAQAHLVGNSLLIDVNGDQTIDATHDMAIQLSGLQGTLHQNDFLLV